MSALLGNEHKVQLHRGGVLRRKLSVAICKCAVGSVRHFIIKLLENAA